MAPAISGWSGGTISSSVLVGSEDRLPLMFNLLTRGPGVPSVLACGDAWPSCDDTWQHRTRLFRLLRRHSPSPLALAHYRTR